MRLLALSPLYGGRGPLRYGGCGFVGGVSASLGEVQGHHGWTRCCHGVGARGVECTVGGVLLLKNSRGSRKGPRRLCGRQERGVGRPHGDVGLHTCEVWLHIGSSLLGSVRSSAEVVGVPVGGGI